MWPLQYLAPLPDVWVREHASPPLRSSVGCENCWLSPAKQKRNTQCEVRFPPHQHKRKTKSLAMTKLQLRKENETQGGKREKHEVTTKVNTL